MSLIFIINLIITTLSISINKSDTSLTEPTTLTEKENWNPLQEVTFGPPKVCDSVRLIAASMPRMKKLLPNDTHKIWLLTNLDLRQR